MPEILTYHKPEGPTHRPADLTAVPWVQIAFGSVAALGTLWALLMGRLNVNFGVLELFAGIGLLRLSRGWRTCALVFVWLGMVGGILCVLAAGLLAAEVDGWRGTGALADLRPAAAAAAAAAFGVAFFALHLWQYRVLTRPAVRALFPRRFGPEVSNEVAAARLAQLQGGPPPPR